MSCRIVLKELLAGAVTAAGILCIGLAGANAADIPPRYTKAAAAAVWDWTGFYAGADIGGAKATTGGRSNFFQDDDTPEFANNPQPSPASSTSSAIGGVHLGYNWQISHLVLGLEGDWQWMSTKHGFCRQTDIGSDTCSDNGRGFLTLQGETRGIGTVRGRLGYAFDRVLVYGTGGVAFVDTRDSITADCQLAGCANSGTRNLTTATFSSVKIGWVAGVGAEVMLSPNWILRSEYLRVDAGSTSDTLNLAPVNCLGAPCGASWSRSQRYDIGRIGFSYKFGGATRID
ncbi:opacity protein [Bradyrhizobium sp. YR681]|uniref:outer membrane protein n=1 Tax=Bradyrhizobium sp. YR681 TaxID=1144344 RepID=UPI00026F7473|nr:outer membrane beta-barrel protein [Bradyrhizobium sp. YR681]EJN09703.1 opacity protein [Bradyrhizobium sp. YR681]